MRNRSRFVLAATLAALSAASGPTPSLAAGVDQDSKALEVMRHADTSLRQVKTLHAKIIGLLDAPLAGTRRTVTSVADVTASRPGRLSMKSAITTNGGPTPQQSLTITDGKTQWNYSAGSKTYHAFPYAARSVEATFGFSPFSGFFDPENSLVQHLASLRKAGRSPSLTTKEDETVDGVRCQVVTLQYDEESDLPAELLAKANGKPLITETYDIGPDGLVRRFLEEHNVGAKREFRVENLVIDAPAAASEFTFTPPANVSLYKPAPVQFLTAGSQAPDFVADPVAGGASTPLHLSDLRGRIVVIDFWAPWCGPCQKAMPHVQKVSEAVRGQNVTVLGLCVWDDRKNFDTWIDKNRKTYTFDFAFDPAGRSGKDNIGERYKVSGIPTTYVIDKSGRVVAAIEDYRQNDTRLEDTLKTLGVTFAAEGNSTETKTASSAEHAGK